MGEIDRFTGIPPVGDASGHSIFGNQPLRSDPGYTAVILEELDICQWKGNRREFLKTAVLGFAGSLCACSGLPANVPSSPEPTTDLGNLGNQGENSGDPGGSPGDLPPVDTEETEVFSYTFIDYYPQPLADPTAMAIQSVPGSEGILLLKAGEGSTYPIQFIGHNPEDQEFVLDIIQGESGQAGVGRIIVPDTIAKQAVKPKIRVSSQDNSQTLVFMNDENTVLAEFVGVTEEAESVLVISDPMIFNLSVVDGQSLAMKTVVDSPSYIGYSAAISTGLMDINAPLTDGNTQEEGYWMVTKDGIRSEWRPGKNSEIMYPIYYIDSEQQAFCTPEEWVQIAPSTKNLVADQIVIWKKVLGNTPVEYRVSYSEKSWTVFAYSPQENDINKPAKLYGVKKVDKDGNETIISQLTPQLIESSDSTGLVAYEVPLPEWMKDAKDLSIVIIDGWPMAKVSKLGKSLYYDAPRQIWRNSDGSVWSETDYYRELEQKFSDIPYTNEGFIDFNDVTKFKIAAGPQDIDEVFAYLMLKNKFSNTSAPSCSIPYRHEERLEGQAWNRVVYTIDSISQEWKKCPENELPLRPVYGIRYDELSESPHNEVIFLFFEINSGKDRITICVPETSGWIDSQYVGGNKRFDNGYFLSNSDWPKGYPSIACSTEVGQSLQYIMYEALIAKGFEINLSCDLFENIHNTGYLSPEMNGKIIAGATGFYYKPTFK